MIVITYMWKTNYSFQIEPPFFASKYQYNFFDMIESYKEIKELGLDAYQVAVVHDEMQYDCAEDVADQVGNILAKHIVDAGIHFNLRCPLGAEYMVGNNWLETH